MRRSVGAITVVIAVAVAAAVLLRREPQSDPSIELGAALTHPRSLHIDGRLLFRGGQSGIHAAASPMPSHRSGANLRLLASATLASAADDHTKAIAVLAMGNVNEAKQRLLRIATASAPVAVWNDLAVVVAANTRSDPGSLFAALGAIDHAMYLGPTEAAVHFNRAMILDHLGLTDVAADAYRGYLTLDGTSEWAFEARKRLRSLESVSTTGEQWTTLVPQLIEADTAAIITATKAFPQEARTWGEGVFLADWAEASMRNNSRTATRQLRVARIIGSALRDLKGETLLADAIAAVDAAAADPKRLNTLRRAHIAYSEARRAYARRDVARARFGLERAEMLFEQGSSPMALVAAYYRANAAIDAGERRDALTRLTGVAARARKGYRALEASIHWSRATIAYFDGMLGPALSSFKLAADGFETLGERRNATDVRARLASIYGLLGQSAEASRMHTASLVSAGKLGDASRLQAVIWAAAGDAVSEERWNVAHALLDLAAGVPDASPTIAAESAVWRPLAAHRAGMSRRVEFELAAAREAVQSLTDASFRQAHKNNLRLVEALLLQRDDPEAARTQLRGFIETASRLDRTTRLPAALIACATVCQQLKYDDDAADDLQRAITLTEQRGRLAGSDVFRDSFLGKSSAAYELLSELYDRHGRIKEAVAAADRRRAQLIVERFGKTPPSETPSVPDIAATLGTRRAMIVYGVFPQRLSIFVITDQGLQRFESHLSRVELKKSIDRFLAAVDGGEDANAVAEGRRLYEVLIEPTSRAIAHAKSLVFVADEPLDRVPFAALVQENGRFLAEDFSSSVTPSIAAYATDTPRSVALALDAIIAVGNPRIDSVRYPNLPSLSAATNEVRRVAALYDTATLLLEENATRAQAVASLRSANVLHFATHALIDPSDPNNSRLLLAADPASQNAALTTAEIAALDLRHVGLTVLAGCSTATPVEGYGSLRTIAAAFLAAGVRHVSASLWDVDDAASREFSIALHRAIRSGLSPEEATRQAQVLMMRSPDPSTAAIRSWAAMQLYGLR